MTVSPQRTTPYPPIGFSSQLQPVADSASACPELIDSVAGGGNVSCSVGAKRFFRHGSDHRRRQPVRQMLLQPQGRRSPCLQRALYRRCRQAKFAGQRPQSDATSLPDRSYLLTQAFPRGEFIDLLRRSLCRSLGGTAGRRGVYVGWCRCRLAWWSVQLQTVQKRSHGDEDSARRCNG